VTCIYVGPPPTGPGQTHPDQTHTASGTSIDLGCSQFDTNYTGPEITGSANGLTVTGSMDWHYSGNSQWSFTGQQTDSETITGRTGQGIIAFMLTWLWTAENDLTAGNAATADFWFNGTEVWQVDKGGMNYDPTFPHTQTIVLNEPFTYGVPFSWQGDVEVLGNGHGVAQTYSSLAVVPIIVPEPGLGWLFGIALSALCFRYFFLPRFVAGHARK
jgi:hypothetical protein